MVKTILGGEDGMPVPPFWGEATVWAVELKNKKIMELFGYKDDCLKKENNPEIEKR